MIYEFDLVIPASTPASAPVYVDMRLTQGIIHRLDVQYLHGPNGKVKVAIRRALHQVWPTNPEGAFKASGHVISYPVWYELEEAPFLLTAWGWSPGTAFDHTVTIRLGVQRREILLPPSRSETFMQRLERLLFGGGQ